MKDLLLKFAGLFVERVPVEERPDQRTGARQSQQARPAPQPGPAGQQQSARRPAALQGHFPSPSGTTAHPPGAGPAARPARPVAAALRAWVPQEYASHLAPHGLHVIAAGGEITPEQAISYGAQVLVVSAECLGSHTHLLERPQLPTVFITTQAAMIPEVPGVVQVQEPLRASEVASASRDAIAAWGSARRRP